MRRITLETYDVETFAMKAARNNGQDVRPIPFPFADGIRQIVETKPDGMQIDEIYQALKIHDAIARSNGVLLLEDAEWTYLLGRLKTHRFPFACEAFVMLSQAIEGAEVVNVSTL